MNSRAIRSQKLYRSDIYQYMNRDEKFVFVYLCTTDLLTLTPFLKITDKQLAFDTDMDIPTVRSVLQSLEEKGLLLRYHDWLFFLHDFAQFEYKNTKKVKKRFLQELQSLPLELLRYIHQSYSNRIRTQFESNSNQYKISNIKYQISTTEYHLFTTLEEIEKLLKKSSNSSIPEQREIRKEEKKEEERKEEISITQEFQEFLTYAELKFEKKVEDNAQGSLKASFTRLRTEHDYPLETLLRFIKAVAFILRRSGHVQLPEFTGELARKALVHGMRTQESFEKNLGALLEEEQRRKDAEKDMGCPIIWSFDL